MNVQLKHSSGSLGWVHHDQGHILVSTRYLTEAPSEPVTHPVLCRHTLSPMPQASLLSLVVLLLLGIFLWTFILSSLAVSEAKDRICRCSNFPVPLIQSQSWGFWCLGFPLVSQISLPLWYGMLSSIRKRGAGQKKKVHGQLSSNSDHCSGRLAFSCVADDAVCLAAGL